MKEKDPYLSELDELGDLEAPTDGSQEAVEEATHIDLRPPEAPAGEEAEGAPPPDEPAVRELIDLSPDIPLQMMVVMGRKGVTVKDLLSFRTGQVIEMDRRPAEPVDLVAGGKVIAKGELVEIDGKLGVRVLRLLK